MEEWFQRFAARVSRVLGSVWTFIGVLTLIAVSGIIFGFSSEWQNFIGFITGFAAFLILFFLQKSQNIGDKATHAKLDELIRSATGARNEFTAAEEKHEHEIDRLRQTIAEECENEAGEIVAETLDQGAKNDHGKKILNAG